MRHELAWHCRILVAAATTLTLAAPAVAQLYELTPQSSSLEVGCFEPCACPIYGNSVEGRFFLSHAGFDGLFDHYDVLDAEWVVHAFQGPRRFRGSGRYRVGGEFAVVQRLELDLDGGAAEVQHFDSGLVPGGGTFPKLDITISLHDLFCLDSAFVVRASPTAQVSVGAGSPAGFEQVRPNPFAKNTEVSFWLARAGAGSLEVWDIAGRRVRSLLGPALLAAGRHARAWDGKDAGGASVRAGVYFLRLAIDGGVRWRSIAKLE